METVPAFHTKNTHKVHAYQKADLERLASITDAATDAWYDEWRRQGSKDEGTCCGGKGISVWYLDRGKRSARKRNLIVCSWVQGNLSASRTVEPALKILRDAGIQCEYNDGWMD